MCRVTIIIYNHPMAKPVLQQGSWPRYGPARDGPEHNVSFLLPAAPHSSCLFVLLPGGAKGLSLVPPQLDGLVGMA